MFVGAKINFLIGKYFHDIPHESKLQIMTYLQCFQQQNPLIQIVVDQFKIIYADKKVDANDAVPIIMLIHNIIKYFNQNNIANRFHIKINNETVLKMVHMICMCTLVCLSKDLDENRIIESVNAVFTVVQISIVGIKQQSLCSCFS